MMNKKMKKMKKTNKMNLEERKKKNERKILLFWIENAKT